MSIYTEKTRTPLEITEGHLVYLNDGTAPIRADAVKVGDVLRGVDATLKVTKIGHNSRTGIYAPLTPNGNLVVGDANIVASSYIGFKNSDDGSLLVSHHDLIHTALSPFRMLCMGMIPTIGHPSNNHSDNGMPYYAYYGMMFLEWIMNQNIVVQTILLSSVLLVTGSFMIVENTFGPTMAPLIMVTIGGYMFAQKRFAFNIQKVKTI